METRSLTNGDEGLIRRIVYLPAEIYAARIDPRLVVELEAEIRDELERGQHIGAPLIERILERVDVNAMDFADSYDRLDQGTYLLVDRYVRPLNTVAGDRNLASDRTRRPYPPRLLRVMAPPDKRPVAPVRLEVLATELGWVERFVLWWRKLSN